jgi:hypothetical protein
MWGCGLRYFSLGQAHNGGADQLQKNMVLNKLIILDDFNEMKSRINVYETYW